MPAPLTGVVGFFWGGTNCSHRGVLRLSSHYTASILDSAGALDMALGYLELGLELFRADFGGSVL